MPKSKPTVVIEVSGGVVQNVYADRAHVILVDWDDQKADQLDFAREYQSDPLRVLPSDTKRAVTNAGFYRLK
jgi:hypothetical protein